MASGSGSQPGDDAASDVGTDLETPSKRATTPRGTRRERDLPPAGQKDKYNEQFRNMENQVCTSFLLFPNVKVKLVLERLIEYLLFFGYCFLNRLTRLIMYNSSELILLLTLLLTLAAHLFVTH